MMDIYTHYSFQKKRIQRTMITIHNIDEGGQKRTVNKNDGKKPS